MASPSSSSFLASIANQSKEFPGTWWMGWVILWAGFVDIELPCYAVNSVAETDLAHFA